MERWWRLVRCFGFMRRGGDSFGAKFGWSRGGGGALLERHTGSTKLGWWLEVEGSSCPCDGVVLIPDLGRRRLGVRHREGGWPPAVFFIGSRSNPKGLVATAARQRISARSFPCSMERIEEEDEDFICFFLFLIFLLRSLVRLAVSCILFFVLYSYGSCTMYFLNICIQRSYTFGCTFQKKSLKLATSTEI
jgi:hypothetical protein